jgi:hypothetical protein
VGSFRALAGRALDTACRLAACLRAQQHVKTHATVSTPASGLALTQPRLRPAPSDFVTRSDANIAFMRGGGYAISTRLGQVRAAAAAAAPSAALAGLASARSCRPYPPAPARAGERPVRSRAPVPHCGPSFVFEIRSLSPFW